MIHTYIVLERIKVGFMLGSILTLVDPGGGSCWDPYLLWWIQVWVHVMIHTYFGGSRCGFMLGSSCPSPAGLSSDS